MIPRKRLEEIAAVLRQPAHRSILVLADEIYERLEYDVEHVAFASLVGMHHRTVGMELNPSSNVSPPHHADYDQWL